MSNTNREWLTIDEAAAYLKVSRKTVRRRISAGQIRGYRIGSRMIRIDKAELDAGATVRPIPTVETAERIGHV